MNNVKGTRIIKHIVVLVAILLLLKVVPKNSPQTRDIVISGLVIFAIYVVADNLFIIIFIVGLIVLYTCFFISL